jgi:hypothetical protein
VGQGDSLYGLFPWRSSSGGAVSIGTGWLGRTGSGPVNCLSVARIFMGAGYLLASQVTALLAVLPWPMPVVEAIGMWRDIRVRYGPRFPSGLRTNRGLALVYVASGSGLGTFLIVPGAERLVAASVRLERCFCSLRHRAPAALMISRSCLPETAVPAM